MSSIRRGFAALVFAAPPVTHKKIHGDTFAVFQGLLRTLRCGIFPSLKPIAGASLFCNSAFTEDLRAPRVRFCVHRVGVVCLPCLRLCPKSRGHPGVNDCGHDEHSDTLNGCRMTPLLRMSHHEGMV